MHHRRIHAGIVALLALAACGGDPASAPPQPTPVAVQPATVDTGTALVEARRCGRALALAARCNYVRDDRDFAVLRYTVLQGLDQRYGAVVDTPRLTEAVDLAVLDRMATVGRCDIGPAEQSVVESGLRDVLGQCAAP
ncbi:MAG: hypothetical protein R3D25_23655 [Geminicoccaceae bacterium]